jgi:hypothetical protein
MDTIFPYFCVIVESCFALFLGGLGIFLIIIAQRYQPDDKECRSWPKSQGVVIDNAIITKRTPKGRQSYVPVLQYIYQANHRMIQGSNIHHSSTPRFLQQEKAQQMLENYPPGRKVWVFFNPKDPEEAVLEQFIYDPKQCLILGMIFIILMILMLSLLTTWWISEHKLVFEHLLNAPPSIWKIPDWQLLLKNVNLTESTHFFYTQA